VQIIANTNLYISEKLLKKYQKTEILPGDTNTENGEVLMPI